MWTRATTKQQCHNNHKFTISFQGFDNLRRGLQYANCQTIYSCVKARVKNIKKALFQWIGINVLLMELECLMQRVFKCLMVSNDYIKFKKTTSTIKQEMPFNL